MTTKRIIVIFVIPALLANCEGCNEDPKPISELEKLPAATQKGMNTFGCLLNGKAWITEISTNAAASYQEGVLAIGAKVNEQGLEQSIGLDLYDDNIETKEYPLNQPTYGGGQFAEYGVGKKTCIYKKTNVLNGTLTITKLDPVNLIISGLFAFETVNAECDTIKITNGRFDLKYAH